jgi:hypothetical protein
VDPAKIKVISNLSVPQNQKDIRSLIFGHDGYYKHFIENFTKIVAPLFKKFSKDIEFSWNEQCQSVFEHLKQKLSETPILTGPNWSLPFHISTDASDSALGFVLGQKENQIHYAIYFIIKNLTPSNSSSISDSLIHQKQDC